MGIVNLTPRTIPHAIAGIGFLLLAFFFFTPQRQSMTYGQYVAELERAYKDGVVSARDARNLRVYAMSLPDSPPEPTWFRHGFAISLALLAGYYLRQPLHDLGLAERRVGGPGHQLRKPHAAAPATD